MGEIRNARCLFLQSWWLQYADHPVDPICRSWPGSITPIMRWILYADHQVAPLGRSLTLLEAIAENKLVDGRERALSLRTEQLRSFRFTTIN